MRKGKLREPQLKRSVLRIAKKRIDNIIPALSIGIDSARISTDKDIATAMSLCDINIDNIEIIAVNRAMDNLISGGAIPIGFMTNILLPEKTEEYVVRDIMKSLERYADNYNLQIMGGHTEFLATINSPIITVTAYGEVDKNRIVSVKNIRPNQDIIMTKWAGLEGSSVIAKLKYDELISKYPKHYIDSAVSIIDYISTIPEAIALKDTDITAIHDVSSGGVFATLWELSVESNVGIEVELKDVPIKQETIEVCEYFNLNPYMLRGNGSLIIVCDNGEEIVNTLQEAGISSSIIGKTTSNNDKVVLIEDEKRFLTPPKGDEIQKVL